VRREKVCRGERVLIFICLFIVLLNNPFFFLLFFQVPFSFGLRLAGESKLSGKVIIKYLEQLWQLYTYKYPWFIFVIIALVLIALALLYVAATTVF